MFATALWQLIYYLVDFFTRRIFSAAHRSHKNRGKQFLSQIRDFHGFHFSVLQSHSQVEFSRPSSPLRQLQRRQQLQKRNRKRKVSFWSTTSPLLRCWVGLEWWRGDVAEEEEEATLAQRAGRNSCGQVRMKQSAWRIMYYLFFPLII